MIVIENQILKTRFYLIDFTMFTLDLMVYIVYILQNKTPNANNCRTL